MKKLIVVFLFLFCLLTLAGCNNRSLNHIIANEPSVTGIVKDTAENAILIENENGEYWVSLDVENKDSMTHFSIGDEVVVYFDGTVAESYPMQINTVYAITLKTPADRTGDDHAASKEDVMMEISGAYVKEVLGLTDVSCVLGNQISAYRLSAGKLETIDYELYPVFVENKVVAFTTCFLSDTGEYMTGCGVDFAESFWQQYSEHPDKPIAIVYAQDGAYLVREGEGPVLLHAMPVAGCDPIQELEKCRDSLVYGLI